MAYRGRLAPSPTGFLHLGHARTFWIAQQRCQKNGGLLVLRNEDLDYARCRPEFVSAMYEDLKWFGLHWDEGPDVSGPFAPYSQSQRSYESALAILKQRAFVYPCYCSRQDILTALTAPHAQDEEPIYPGTCRPNPNTPPRSQPDRKVSWRFRVPDGEVIRFNDMAQGPQEFVAGRDFGDFVVWRHDNIPSYQLAVTADDAAMGITEVVRGADLLLSTARQLLLFRALAWDPPAYYHCPLMTDHAGRRLAKRHDSLSLRSLRESGTSPETLRAGWEECIA